ncbi:MAG: AAA family ATPase [Pirellulales bacterium]|nr:AAA family ATPase [Pirellulales bacterium]
MKITDLKIDGFGVWHDLSLRGLSPELTVFYGPNEAGKSTLMQFMRSILYGMSPTRRERYLPPVVGGRPGGWLKVQTENGPLTISRYADRGPNDVGKVTIITAEGEEQGDRLLRESLEHVDEPTYLNIFAVGLREVQELGSLSDTAAAQWLYRLTSGLDRISLYDVIHMLEGTRLRLLNSWEEKSELRGLLSKQEQLRGELEELIAKGRRWAQSAVRLRELAEEVDARQAEAKAIAARSRRLEVAISVKPLWIKRGKLDDQLERFQNLQPLGEGTLETLEDFNKHIEEHDRQRDILRGQRQQLRDEANRLGINQALVSSSCRLNGLLEQTDWLQSVERQAAELADEVKHFEARLASENERLAQEWTGGGKLPPRITSDIVDQLAPQSRAVEATAQLVTNARYELEVHRAGESEFRAQIESAVTSGEKLGLPKDVQAAGELVAQLRRRHQLDQRIAAAQGEAETLDQQAHDLVNEQVVPIELFVLLGMVFIGGVACAAAWWLLPASSTGKYGGWFALAAVVAALVAAMYKFLKESRATDRFDTCHYQIDTLLEKIESAEHERAELDHELGLGGGSVATRLQHAERHLAELERILPVESQHREVAEALSSADRRLKLAEEKHTSALANWKARLQALGLPKDISPENLAAMATQCERLAELEARIENRRDDMQRRQREFTIVSDRIVALADETNLRREKVTSIEQLDYLRAQYHQHQQRVEQRKGIRERAKSLRAEARKHHHAGLGYRRRREALFQKCGVADEQELRQLAARLAEFEDLRHKRAAVTREILAAIGKHGTEADFAPFLAEDQIGRLEHEWESLSTQSEELERQLKEALQRRGAMVEQQRTAAADQSLALKQLELDVIEQQIRKAVDAWRERAAVSLFLERIREEYEQHRQPETLREASLYMSQLTDGRYTRIWTPLAHDILFVDTAEGQSLSVQVLSRGTREQLFVSLRLALVAAYARRGIHLPMILDDVFVNYDAGRTRTACAVLRNFAKQGHQLMVFTCHEHVWQMFKEISVDCRRIPNRLGSEETQPETLQPETPQPELSAETIPEPTPEPSAEPALVAEQQLPAPEPEPVPIPEPPPTPKPAKRRERRQPVAEKPVESIVVQEPEFIIDETEEIVYDDDSSGHAHEIEYWWEDAAGASADHPFPRWHEQQATSERLSEPDFRPWW